MRVDQLHKQKIWRCDCGGSHFLSISRWLDSSEAYLNLEAEDHHLGLWERIKAAWNILLHGQHMWFEIVLNPTTIREICDELESMTQAEVQRFDTNIICSKCGKTGINVIRSLSMYHVQKGRDEYTCSKCLNLWYGSGDEVRIPAY